MKHSNQPSGERSHEHENMWFKIILYVKLCQKKNLEETVNVDKAVFV